MFFQQEHKSRLHSLDFNLDEIVETVRSLNVNKGYAHDDISIRMIKICDKPLVISLSLLFERSFNNSSSEIFFSKVYEKIIFNRMYTFHLNEQLLNPNQSGFRPSDSRVNKPITVNHLRNLPVVSR